MTEVDIGGCLESPVPQAHGSWFPKGIYRGLSKYYFLGLSQISSFRARTRTNVPCMILGA